MKTFKNYYYLIKEGGNMFDGCRRINKNEVLPTIEYLEKIINSEEGQKYISLLKSMLGSTGKTDTSGDIDIAVDSSVVTKDKLLLMLTDKGETKKGGLGFSFKSPIYGPDGRQAQGFVQVDFAFTEDVEFLKWYFASDEITPGVRGKERTMVLSALAKPKGLLISQYGLYRRDPKMFITRDPSEIARALLDDRAKVKNLHNIDEVCKYLVKTQGSDIARQILEPAGEAVIGVLNKYI